MNSIEEKIIKFPTWSLAATGIIALFFLAGIRLNPAPVWAEETNWFEPAVNEVKSTERLHFNHPQGREGVNLKDITAIVQDRTGFIWIGTVTGLYRYDGYRFRQYRHDPADRQSLSHNHITDILVDDGGGLWVSTLGGGVNRFDPADQFFTRFRHNPADENSIGGDIVFTVFLDSHGRLWCGGPPTTWLNRFDPDTGTWTRFKPNPGDAQGIPPECGIWEMVEDKSGRLWMAADFILMFLDPDTGRFRHITLNPFEKRLNELMLDRNGFLWCGGATGLYQVETATGRTIKHVLSPHTRIDALLQDASGRIRAGTEHRGLISIDPESGEILNRHEHDPTDDSSLSGNGVTALFEDAAEMLWIGTVDGLDLMNAKQTQFRNFRHEPQNGRTLARGRIEALSGDDRGFLWVAAGGLINRLDYATGHVARYPLVVDHRPLFASSFSAVHCDRDGRVWFGLRGDPALYRLDGESGFIDLFSPLGAGEPQGPPPEITGFFEDSDGRLFLAVDHYGLFVLDRQRRHFESYHPHPPGEEVDDSRHLAGGRVTALSGGREGRLWIGSANGVLSAFTPKTGRFTHYFPDSQNPLSLPPYQIMDIHEDRDRMVWLATVDGLVKFDPRGKTAVAFTEDDGLPNPAVVGIMEDEAGRLWLETKSGLSRFNPRDRTFMNYFEVDGLVDNELTARARWRGPDGRLFFGGDGGVTAFKPSELKKHDRQPAVVLTELLLFNQLVLPGPDAPLTRPVWESREVVLPHDRNVVSVEFAIFSYLAPERNRYRYILEGLDRAERTASGRRPRADYAHLPPGKYVFKVTGSDHHGLSSSKTGVLAITIRPPWWATPIFRILAVSVLLGLAFAGYRLRLNSLKKRERELEREVANRTADLAASEKRFATVMNSMDAIMFVVEFDTCELLFVNQRFREVFGAEEGRTCRQIVPEHQSGLCEFCTMDRLVKDGKPTGVHIWEMYDRGHSAWYQNRIQAIHWIDDRLVRLAVSTDITHLKEVQEQLREAKSRADSANQAKSAFLANMSHELRTPLNAVIGFSQIMRRNKSLPAEEQENLEIIMRSGEHLLDLINQVLDLSKIEAGRITLDPMDFDLHSLLDDIRDMFSYKTQTKGLALDFVRNGDLPRFITADRVKLRQILINLLNNALKFTKIGGVTLTVEATDKPVPVAHTDPEPLLPTRSPAFLHFEVADTGPGISADEIDKLFQAFVQTESGRQSQEGTGLGLTISHRFVELMGGRLDVRSEVGRGTTFFFDIAVRLSADRPDRLPADERSWDRVVGLEPGRPVPRILVADDQPHNRRLVLKILTPLGFSLKEAVNGEDVLDVRRQWRPDLILMDMRMPVLDGLEATRRIRAEEKESETKIIAVTAGALQEDRTEAIEAGCDDFLRKPFKTKDLLQILQRCLDINYVYEDESPQNAETTRQSDLGRDLLPEDLDGLPPELLADLKHTVDRVDFDKSLELVKRIEDLNRPLAGTLTRLLESYRFDRIQTWLDHFPSTKE